MSMHINIRPPVLLEVFYYVVKNTLFGQLTKQLAAFCNVEFHIRLLLRNLWLIEK